jgi:tetratricopeptide (TPR) repeat protein
MSLDPNRSRRVLGFTLLLVGLAFAAYSNSLKAPLVLDDTLNITNNTSLRQLWPPQPARVATMRGRPVANFSFALNYAAGGLRVEGYHVVNLLIHAAAGLTLFGIIRQTLRLPALADRFAAAADVLAFAAAALWLLHPLQTEAVTYVSQRTESLMGLFYLLTLYAFIRGSTAAPPNRSWLFVAVLSFLLGLGCKEVIVTAPVVLLLYDRTFLAGSFAEAWRRRRGFYLGLAACWLVLAALMIDFENRGVGLGLGVTPWEYAVTESWVVLRYLRLALWPTPLVFDYGSGVVKSLAEVWPAALLLVALLVGVGVTLRRRPKLGFLLAAPFLLLGPTSSVVPLAQQPMAEHRLYLPLAALAVLIVVAFHLWLGRRGWWLLGAVTVGLGAATYQRNAIYADAISLWEDTARKSPGNDRAYQNLGNAYLHAGRMAAAEKAYQTAFTLNRYNPDAINNLGFIYAQTGRIPKAINYFHWAKQLLPNDAEAYYNLGCVFLSEQQLTRAQAEFERALQLNPQHAHAHSNLGTVLSEMGRYGEALQHYSAALRLNPNDAEAYASRAYAYFRSDRLSAAIADYEQALKLRPEFEAARKNLETIRKVRPLNSAP